MKSIYRKYVTLSLSFLLILSFGCKKDYLDIKPNQSLLIPTTLPDMQSLLDNVDVTNRGIGLPSLATDDYQVSTINLATFTTPAERNTYIWATDIYEARTATDWELPYQQIFYANVVLDGLEKIATTNSNQADWNSLKGSALFYRAFAFYELADEFTVPYNSATASSVPGIPIKVSSDVNERPGRGTLQQVYMQIINDLNEAIPFLPLKQSIYLSRPSKLAVWALLARVHLAIGEYHNALKFANQCLDTSPALLDYNLLSTSSTRPIAAGNPEVIFLKYMPDYSFTSSVALSIAPNLFGLYATNDLRKAVFLRDRGNGILTFKGNYTGNRYIFSGLAFDEIYLIRAECKARANDKNGAMADLNTLMLRRWSNRVTFPVFTAVDAEDALKQILTERRKELFTRGTRWADLKRLNQDTRFAITLTRNFNDRDYFLNPNDIRYAFPIPQNEIDGSGIEQNAR